MKDLHEIKAILDPIADHASWNVDTRKLWQQITIGGSPEDSVTVDPDQDPSPMDTLGSLIDKLTIVNLKMWHNQETLYAIRRMDLGEFEQSWGNDIAGIHGLIKRACDLNVQRSTLMDAIDKHFAAVLSGEKKAEIREQHKTY